MPRFAANISLLFAELPFFDRFSAARRAGFQAVEILFPYDVPAQDIKTALEENDLELILMNAPPPVETGLRGFPADPDEADVFQSIMPRVLQYAEVLCPDFIHVMAGYKKGAKTTQSFVENLQWLSDVAPDQKFTIEPLNGQDQPGYFLDDYALAKDILFAVGRANVGLQYDAYHAQVIHGDAAKIWEDYKSYAMHVQIGAAPDRSEPGRGPIDFNALFAAIDATGYDGWISAEYYPSTVRTEESLRWKTGW
ncbi:MAG: hydroxypyruvate isomerase family protein [Paracoccaceae bacterium]